MANEKYHLKVPANLAGCAGAAALQTAMDAYNAAVSAGGTSSPDAIAANKLVQTRMSACFLEQGLDVSKIMRQ